MKIVFFGTSIVGAPILTALHEAGHEILEVVTSPDALVGRKQILTPSAISDRANELKLKISKPEKVKNNAEFIQHLKELNADIFIVVSYGKILPLELIDIPPLKTINVHFSLLPKYRGAAPIQYALLNGETTTGTTIFILDELVDHGDIIAQGAIDIEPTDTFLTLAEKLSYLSAHILIDLLPVYADNGIEPRTQIHDEATSTKLIKKEDGFVDFTAKTAQEIYNMWRAFALWPGIYTKCSPVESEPEKQLKILECRVVAQDEPRDPANRAIIPCAKDTYLELMSVQLEGKKPTKMDDFLRGYKDFKLS